MHTRPLARRWAVATVAAAVSVAALGACGSSSSTSSKSTDTTTAKTTVAAPAAPADYSTTCKSWLELDTKASQGPGGDEQGPPSAAQMKSFAASLKPTVDTIGDGAPDAIADDLATIKGIVDDAAQGKNTDKLDPSNPDLGDPVNAVEEWVHQNCGYTALDVTAVNYAYQGIPATVKAGSTSIKFTNSSKDEQHEMAIVKINDGASVTSAELVAALKKDSQAAEQKYGNEVTFVGDASASPGKTGYDTLDLEPGQYVASCFVGADSGTPHAQLGMVTPFTVS